ncbi:chromosome condensation protein [Amycolatopsis sp. Hca4]|uniref:phthiocerol/phthiodiolone dimycocerosyl transferase family protein n=1 Tax=Amycolatopsis sp. Hca4 TaxID=2742131 RepID=UPI0020CAA68D|nr:chromosome condensation protein [Amycolatopsis sp. Hca4]
MRDERALTDSEAAFLLAGFGPVVVRADVGGTFDPALLDRAWRLLGQAYPLLRCGVLGGPDGFRLVLREAVPAPVADADDFRQAIGRRLGDGAVSRLSLRETNGATELTLAVDHAFSDGRLVQVLLGKLLEFYAVLRRGDTPSVVPRPVFEPGLQHRLTGRYEPGWPEPADVPGGVVTLAGGPGTSSPGFGVHRIELGRGPTAALAAFAGTAGISVTGLLCGAVAGAVLARRPGDTAVRPVTLSVPVDFRRRLAPPIDPDAQLCAALPCLVTVSAAATDDPVDIGLRVAAELRAAIRRAEPQRTLLAQCLVPAPPPPMTFLVSNLGVREYPELPGDLSVTTSRVAATLPGPVPAVFAVTVNGELALDVVYDRAFHDDSEVSAVAASVETTLRSTAER